MHKILSNLMVVLIVVMFGCDYGMPPLDPILSQTGDGSGDGAGLIGEALETTSAATIFSLVDGELVVEQGTTGPIDGFITVTDNRGGLAVEDALNLAALLGDRDAFLDEIWRLVLSGKVVLIVPEK